MYHCSVSTSTLFMADRTSHYRRVLRIALKTRVFINSTLTGSGLCPGVSYLPSGADREKSFLFTNVPNTVLMGNLWQMLSSPKIFFSITFLSDSRHKVTFV